MKKERPILFSTEMVNAILQGRKTQTRRIAKVPYGDHQGTDIMDWALSEHPYFKDGEWQYRIQTDVDDFQTVKIKCPYGQIGDVLWVRETWQKVETYPEPDAFGKYLFKSMGDTCSKWRPSIFMPREACRIKLKITDIRVERLGEISEEDAIAEGVEERSCRCGGFGYYEGGGEIWDCNCQNWPDSPQIMGWQDAWTHINGSYDPQTWVWVISFKRI